MVVSVCANAQVDLLLAGVFSVGGHQPKEGIFWSLRHDIGIKERADGPVGDGAHGVLLDL